LDDTDVCFSPLIPIHFSFSSDDTDNEQYDNNNDLQWKKNVIIMIYYDFIMNCLIRCCTIIYDFNDYLIILTGIKSIFLLTIRVLDNYFIYSYIFGSYK